MLRRFLDKVRQKVADWWNGKDLERKRTKSTAKVPEWAKPPEERRRTAWSLYLQAKTAPYLRAVRKATRLVKLRRKVGEVVELMDSLVLLKATQDAQRKATGPLRDPLRRRSIRQAVRAKLGKARFTNLRSRQA